MGELGRTSPVHLNTQLLMLIHGEKSTLTLVAPHEKIPIRKDTVLLIEVYTSPFERKTNLPVPVKRMYFNKRSSNISTALG